MHPNAAFHWIDRSEMLDFVAEHSFAHIFTASEAGQFVVHAPVIVRDGRIWFHVAKRNRIADQLDGATPIEVVRQRAEEKFATTLSLDTLNQFIKTLEKGGLLESEIAPNLLGFSDLIS